MPIRPVADHGQKLDSPQGKVIGFIDSKAEFDGFAAALRAAGYAATGITTLYGEDGIHLLERLKENSFFFGDSEDSIIQQSTKELRAGHYAVAISVKGHTQAAEIANLATPYGGHGFSYFGMWVTEQLTP